VAHNIAIDKEDTGHHETLIADSRAVLEHEETDEPTIVKLYGLVAEFEDVEPLVAAARKVRDAGYRRVDAYTPFPIEGLAEILAKVDVKVPFTMLAGGFIGFLGGFGFLVWATAIDYPLNIGGRPLVAWPSFIPISYELTILTACILGIAAMIFLNGLPMPYHPVFNAPNFERATTDRFFLGIEAGDKNFDRIETRRLLESLHPLRVSEVGTEE
jgi:hypothetical protein